jgi:hypothetical protein
MISAPPPMAASARVIAKSIDPLWFIPISAITNGGYSSPTILEAILNLIMLS